MNKVFLLCEGASLSALLHTCKLATESAGFTCWEAVWCVKWAPYWEWVLPCTTDPKPGFVDSLVATELWNEVRAWLGISTVLSCFLPGGCLRIRDGPSLTQTQSLFSPAVEVHSRAHGGVLDLTAHTECMRSPVCHYTCWVVQWKFVDKRVKLVSPTLICCRCRFWNNPE